MSRLKLFLWQLGLYPDRCPYCGEGLKSMGYPNEGFQKYICPSVCKFNG